MFGIIRVRNLNNSDVSSTEKHNFRLYETKPQHLGYEKNILADKNHYLNDDNVFIDGEIQDKRKGEKGDLKRAIESRFKKEGVKTRKNSVVALEYVLAISPDAVKDIEKTYMYDVALDRLAQFIEKKHGIENVIAKSFHFDESNPHVHVIVTPIKEKIVKWKNKNGVGEKLEKRLSARDYTGNKHLLRNLQSDFYYHCASMPFAKTTKHKFERGIGKKERLALGFKEYDTRTNKKLGEVKNKITELKNDIEKAESLIELKEINKRLELEEEKAKEIAKTESYRTERDAKKSFEQTTKKITERYTQEKPKKGGGMTM
jgi:hypothetical protein